jgi:hypothetical protein
MTALLTAIDWLTQLGCIHQDIFRRDQGCLCLECLRCGRQTPGITVHSRAQATEEEDGWTEPRSAAVHRAA